MASNLGSNKQELDAKETRYKKMISSRRKKWAQCSFVHSVRK